MTQSARHATFLLRYPRKTQGFRDQLTDGRSVHQAGVYEEGVYEKGVFAEGVFEAGNGDARDSHQALTMLWIPPGRFWMGSPEDELERSGDEGPQHLVQLEGFFLSQMPITQAQWRVVAQWQPREGESWGRKLKPNPSRLLGEGDRLFKREEGQLRELEPNRYRFLGERVRLLEGETTTDQRPVVLVSWHDAMEFCSRLSQRTGRTYTLPSEAQWEYACRAGTTTPFHFGETITPELANYNGTSAYANGPKGEYREQTTPVGSFPANAWGLQDMHGNVREWCLDHWHGSYERAPTDGSAWLDPEAGDVAGILLRGGSWYTSPRGCRSGCRCGIGPGSTITSSDVGFRVVCLPQGRSA